jgi:hypothetical protein
MTTIAALSMTIYMICGIPQWMVAEMDGEERTFEVQPGVAVGEAGRITWRYQVTGNHQDQVFQEKILENLRAQGKGIVYVNNSEECLDV